MILGLDNNFLGWLALSLLVASVLYILYIIGVIIVRLIALAWFAFYYAYIYDIRKDKRFANKTEDIERM